MKRKMLSLVLCLTMLLGMCSSLTGCSGGTDAFVMMLEQPDGLFNPFFSTSASDGSVVSLTQIGMLGSDFVDGELAVAYGEDNAVVTKDYDIVEENGNTIYTFVLKNGILFSDGQPLTMEDVLFNYYVYLDPVYTGSNTLYSTKIVGLDEYRTQTVSSNGSGNDSMISDAADDRANARINELVNLFSAELKMSTTKEVGYEAMKEAIRNHTVSSGYQSAISNNPSEVTFNNLLNDYENAVKGFKEELGDDFIAAQEAFTEEPYKSHPEFKDEIFCFMFMEGYVEVKYAEGEDGKVDRTKMEKLTKSYPDTLKNKADAINYVYNDMVSRQLDMILWYSVTAGELKTEYTAKAKEVILHENASEDGSLLVPNIEGIKSLGHTERAGETITVNGKEYKVASAHNEDGTVKNADEYDVLQITIEGVDPKAIWNFALTVAPQHYYGEGSKVGMDIANNKFGVEFASFEFMSSIIQSPRNVKIPMGAGAYKATDASNKDNPGESNFYKDNLVYFKANENFHTVGEGIENAKIGKVRYQVMSSNNAIGNLQTGNVHYISPALTGDNYDKLQGMKKDGYEMISTDQLGYGYIGVNAAKVNDINLRRAIMCAMNTAQAVSFYRSGTAEQIFWNMSTVSWAYPKNEDGTYNDDNGHDYPMAGNWSDDIAKANIQKYMDQANYTEKDLRITFTIAGSTLQDHPTYTVFRDAAALLNSMGWDITVVCDTQALTKISTGSLAVWAAAWSSALDPDMYQVYHKDSSATSVKAWGYPHIKNSGSSEELAILDDLSELIDQARETNDQEERTALYEEAMGYILDLAVELPVYQRDVLYAYNAKVINPDSMPKDVNPYSTPLDRIWELEFAN